LDEDPEDDETLEAFEFLFGLDPGIATSVLAISAAGAAPLTSCRGGPGHYEQHPLVGFWAERETWERIRAAAIQAEIQCGASGYNSLMVWVETPEEIQKMREFAKILMASL
jgi:hypothetical protein